jgi:hypothetical protein
MAVTEVIVDAINGIDQIGGNGADGYATLQFALDDTTLGTDGSRALMRNNANHTVTNLTTTTHGAPTQNAPLTIIGVDSSTNVMTPSTSRATIDANNGVIGNDVWSFLFWINLEFISTGETVNTEIIDHSASNGGMYYCKLAPLLHVRGINHIVCSELPRAREANMIVDSYIHREGSMSGSTLSAANSVAIRTIFVDESTDTQPSLQLDGDHMLIYGCTFDGRNNTGSGVYGLSASTGAINHSIYGNIFANYDGTSQAGINFTDADQRLFLYARNYFYNNTSNENGSNSPIRSFENDTSTNSNPFAEVGTYGATADLDTYFDPLEVGTPGLRTNGGIMVGSNLDIGAVQHSAAPSTKPPTTLSWMYSLQSSYSPG